jgi:hypothetical protein
MTLARWAAARTSEPSTNVRYSLLAGGGSATKISKGPSGGNGKTQAPKSPASAAATAPGKSHERFSGNTGFVLGQIVPGASKAASPDTAICKADTDSHHAYPRTVHHRLDLLGTARIGENLDVDAKPVGVYVQGGNGHDSVFLATEYRIDGQRGGQCALRRPIPSGRRPLTLIRF